MEALFFVLIAVLIVVAIGWSHWQAQKRRKMLMEWAQAREWSFSPDNDYGIDSRYSAFSCFKQGSARYGYNLMNGRHGSRPTSAFDYHYETYSTDSKGNRTTHHHYFSSIVVETALPLKPLLIRGETFFDKIGEFMGFDDIDFELAEFSRSFYVTAPEKRWAFDVLHQEAMEFLLHSPRFALEFHGGRVIAYRNKLFSTTDFEWALEVVSGLLDRLPRSVLRELKGSD